MALPGPAFYDQASVFESYMQHRAQGAAPNNTMEGPLLRELLGDVQGQDVLDLGCGAGGFGSELLADGAASYLGVDGSANMVAQARTQLQADSRAQIVHADLQTWPMPAARFSRVTARLALHYLPALEPLLQAVHAALRPGGRLVFSVEHPVITCCDRAWRGQGLRQEWIVDDYFRTGERETDWIGSRVRKYHRTVEDHFLALQACGFIVESLREGRPERARFLDDADYERRRRIPLFLVMAARKAPASAEAPAG
jgi:SAM-dependent methyltransferase